MSFPGGMEDPEDNGDPVATARRETVEELGVSASSIRILGTYHQSLSKTKIPGTRSPSMVYSTASHKARRREGS